MDRLMKVRSAEAVMQAMTATVYRMPSQLTHKWHIFKKGADRTLSAFIAEHSVHVIYKQTNKKSVFSAIVNEGYTIWLFKMYVR